MATYSKTTWATGDLITADKMNKIETQLETTTPGATGSVRFDTSSSLTDAQKAQARTNIDVLSTTETNNRLAAAYNSATNYVIDDYCMYNNKIYRCIAAATNILPTNTAYWVEENTVSGALKSLNGEKADIDGYYTGLTAGNAEQLISSVKEKDTTPYVFRTSGGDVDIGNRREISLTGGSIAWNQFCENGNFTSDSGWTLYYPSRGTKSVANNIMTLSWTTEAAVGYGYGLQKTISKIPQNHVVLYSYDVKPSLTAGFFIEICGAEPIGAIRTLATANTWNCIASVGKVASNSASNILLKPSDMTGGASTVTNGDSWQIKNVNVFDLTQMFGTTIADYVYNLEQAEAGAGVAWFKKLFPKDYYAYNAGTLMSVNAARAETVGFNLLDLESLHASDYYVTYANNKLTNVLTDTKSTLTIDVQFYNWNTYVFWGSGNTSLISGNRYKLTITIPDRSDWNRLIVRHNGSSRNINLFYIPRELLIPGQQYCISWTAESSNPTVVGGVVLSDINVNLSWSGYRNGEYEPYKLNTYALDADLTLRGIPKLDASNKLYYDGDTYASDGKVTRRCQYFEFDGSSDESWGLQSINDAGIANFYVSGIPVHVEDAHFHSICNRFQAQNTTIGNTTTEGYLLSGGTTFYVRIDSTKASTPTEFKTWLANNPVSLVYILQTPTTETADPYVNPQIVDDFGTEEFVDAAVEAGDRDVSVPVGHNSQYMNNLRDKLQHLPDLASSNGTYVITQANSQMTLTPLTTPTELPAAPTTNGTYKLRCVVSSGTATYSWVADS